MQNLPMYTSTIFVLNSLGTTPIEHAIDHKKLIFFGQLCRLPAHYLAKQLFVNRLLRFVSGDRQCQGFIPDIYRLLTKYNMHDILSVFIQTANFPSKNMWATFVGKCITDIASREMMQQHHLLVSLPTVYPTLFDPNAPSCVWQLLRKMPNLRKQCFCAMQILAKLFSKMFITKCRKCDLYSDNIVCHVMFHCVKVQEYRKNLWSAIIYTFGLEVYNQHIQGTKEDQICDIISGMYLYSRYSSESFVIVCLNLLYKMFRVES